MADIFDELDFPEINTNQPSEKTKKIAKGFKLFGYEPKPETIAPIQHQLEQKIRYPGTELVSQLLGGFGDIGSLVNKLLGKPIQGKEFEEIPILGQIPTSERLHRGFEEFAGEKIRPETFGEELFGTGLGFLGSILGLGGGKTLTKAGQIAGTSKKIPASVKSALTVFAPALAYTSAKKADLPAWMQVGATIGTSLLTHKLTNKSISQVKNELYGMRDSLSKNVIIPGAPLAEDLNKFYAKMQVGGLTSVEKHIMNFLDNIKSKAEGGDIPLDDLLKGRSKLFQESKMFTKEQRKGTERFWNEAERILDSQIKKYKNPEFQKINSEANSLNRGIEQSKKMETFLKKHWKESALGAGGEYLLKQIGFSLGLPTAGALIGGKSLNFINALRKNPGFRKAYKDLLINATNENLKGTTRSLKNFNQYYDNLGLDKDESKKDIFDELD